MASRVLSGVPGSIAASERTRLLKDPIAHLSGLFREHGRVFKTNIGVPAVFLVGPDANKVMLTTHRHVFSYKEGYAMGPDSALFSGSLLTLNDEEAATERAMLQPAIGKLGIAENVRRVGPLLAQRLGSLDDGRSHDVLAVMAAAGFELALTLQLGLEQGEHEFEAIHPLVQQLMDGSKSTSQRGLKRAMAVREALIDRLIPRIEAARNNPDKGLVALLIQAVGPRGERLSTRRIAEHLLLLFWAGYDTFAATSAWMAYELAVLPEWQDRLIAHQREILSGDRPPQSLEELNRLELHGWVMKETERFRPMGLFFARVTTEDFEYSGFHLPEGTVVCYSAFLTHRMEELFKDAQRFDPSRWDPAVGAASQFAAHLVGFGAGPRVCLGKGFAQMQLRLALWALLPQYRLERDPAHTLRVQPFAVHHPEEAFLFFKRR